MEGIIRELSKEILHASQIAATVYCSAKKAITMAGMREIDKELFCAVEQGNVERTIQCFHQEANVLIWSYNFHHTVLHVAVRGKNEEVIKLVVNEINKKRSENSITINVKDRDGDTPLMWAAESGYTIAAQTLLDLGANPELKNKNGMTALDWAKKNGHPAIESLLTSTSQIEQELFDAIQEDNLDRIKQYFNNGGNVFKWICNEHQVHHTVLHMAVCSNNEQIIKFIINKMAERESESTFTIDVKDKDGNTPLMWAAKTGIVIAAQTLLDHGANTELKNENGMTALDWAKKNSNTSIENLLNSSGPSRLPVKAVRIIDEDLFDAVEDGDLDGIKQCFKNGANVFRWLFGDHHTFLHVAVRSNNEQIIKLVLNKMKERESEHSFTIDIKDKDGNTPLMWAAETGKIIAAQTLLDHGANPELKNKNGMTALHWSKKNRHTAIEHLLISSGPSRIAPKAIRVIDQDLLDAIEDKDLDRIKQCFNNGANVFKWLCDDHHTVLHVAVGSNNEQIIKLVLDRMKEKESESSFTIDVKDKDGNTPLMWAAKMGKIIAAQTLLDHGANYELRNENGMAALDLSKKNRNTAIEHLLNSRGSSTHAAKALKVIDQNLFDAIEDRDLDRITQCFNKGANVFKWLCDNHHTVLHVAVRSNNMQIIEFVLNKMKEKESESSFTIDVKDKEGNTPLMWAAETGRVIAAQILLDHGANPEFKNENGMTALDWAKKNRHTAIENVLNSARPSNLTALVNFFNSSRPAAKKVAKTKVLSAADAVALALVKTTAVVVGLPLLIIWVAVLGVVLMLVLAALKLIEGVVKIVHIVSSGGLTDAQYRQLRQSRLDSAARGIRSEQNTYEWVST